MVDVPLPRKGGKGFLTFRWENLRETGREFCGIFEPYRSPSGPKSQKSRKKVAGASRPWGQKRVKKKTKVVFESFLTFFFSQPFLIPGPRGPGIIFQLFF